MNSQVSQFISERESDDLFEILKKGNGFDFNNFDSEINQMFEKSDIEFIKVKLLQLDSFIKDSFVTNNEQPPLARASRS